MSDLDLKWISEFKAKHGRNPRIIHVGNIAANAFKNVKMLNKLGLDCDVVSYNYYHIMACPEWEDAEFDYFTDNQMRPTWYKHDLHGYQRPRWFIQGSLADCARYIDAKFSGDSQKEESEWLKLCEAARIEFPQRNLYLRQLLRAIKDSISNAFIDGPLDRLFSIVGSLLFKKISPVELRRRLNAKINSGGLKGGLAAIIARSYEIYFGPPSSEFDLPFAKLSALFKGQFPNRPDQLKKEDLQFYFDKSKFFERIFAHYDLVQCYSSDPIYALLTNRRPYVAFEHGTLRACTQSDLPDHRLTALAYNQADHVFVTNGDCLEYARKINDKNWSGTLHPLDLEKIRATKANLEIRSKYSSKYVFLCPLRHNWAVKGTDKVIRALPILQSKVGDTFTVLMTEWGEDLDRSKNLARELKVDHLIDWIDPLPKIKLIETVKAVDLVFDQTILPCFGATAPEAIACETPIIMSYRPETTSWILGEPAPILCAFDETQIADKAMQAIDPQWLGNYKKTARTWVDNHHSDARVVRDHLTVYEKLLSHHGSFKRTSTAPAVEA